MLSLGDQLKDWLTQSGMPEEGALWLRETTEVLVVALAAWLANVVTKRIVLGIVHQFAKKTATHWDDVMVERRVFHRLSHLAPAMVIHSMAPIVLQTEKLISWGERGAQVYMLLVVVLVVDAALNAVNQIYNEYEVSKRIPILGYLQVVKLAVSMGAIIIAVSIVIDKSPMLLLSGIGAATAIILLIFKDTILGFVAGIQLVANDMVRPGDWIEMPKYGADGDVEEITLNVVKVRNFDKTVTTIPTYALISDSFKNWRGMSESGGRRIKRQIKIDVNSIHFCSPELLDKLRKVDRIAEYLETRQKEIDDYNALHGGIDKSIVNGRRMTNVGVFRHYIQAYLRENPNIRKDMTFLVRQLEPGAEGLPIELYVFSGEQRWIQYEGIQADIFDHLFAVLPEFELRPYQNPSGRDISAAAEALRSGEAA